MSIPLTGFRCLVLVAASLLAGCASTTEILRSTSEAVPTKPAHSLLVAGVSTDDALRRRYESVFVEELQKARIAGIASSTLIPTTQGLTMTEIREKMHAAATQADAVIHVQLVALTSTQTLSPADIPAEQAPASRDVNGISLTINAPPPGTNSVRGTQLDVELQATLYELPQRKLLWSVTTRTHEANKIEAAARSHARALIAAMREHGYLAR